MYRARFVKRYFEGMKSGGGVGVGASATTSGAGALGGSACSGNTCVTSRLNGGAEVAAEAEEEAEGVEVEATMRCAMSDVTLGAGYSPPFARTYCSLCEDLLAEEEEEEEDEETEGGTDIDSAEVAEAEEAEEADADADADADAEEVEAAGAGSAPDRSGAGGGGGGGSAAAGDGAGPMLDSERTNKELTYSSR
jgi:hypothetical protein